MSARNYNWITAILAAAVAPMAVGQLVSYRGLDHTPLGAATLVVLPNDTLQVSNIGPLGADGVSVDLTGAQFARGAFADVIPGATWQAETFSGATSLALTRFVGVGADWELFHSFPFLGAVVMDVEAFLDGELVASATSTGGPLVLFATSRWQVSYATEVAGVVRTTIEFDPTPVLVLGTPMAQNADRLVISTSIPTSLPTLTRVDITAMGTTDFRVTDGMLGMFGHRHRALGQATLDASGLCPSCTLHISNIGSSGNDGVEVELDGAVGFSTVWAPLPAPFPNGASLVSSAIGTVGGVPDTLFGELAFEDQGANLRVSADFSGVGATTRIVEVYLRGVLVHRLTGQSGASVATLADTDWPIGTSAHTRVIGDLLPGFRATWPASVSFTLSGGPIVSGDELVVMAENPTNIPSKLAAKQDNETDLPGLDIANENCIPECPGDVDGDNDVDISDLGIVLMNFGMAGATINDGDMNGDTFVNITDLGIVLGAFGESCPDCEQQN